MAVAKPAIHHEPEAPFRCDPPMSCWTRSISPSTFRGPSPMLAYCCPPPWPSGWGSRRPLTSSSTSVTAPARRAPAASPGPGLPAVGVHGDGRAVILDDRDADAPVLEEARLLARLSRGSRVVLFELSERV